MTPEPARERQPLPSSSIEPQVDTAPPEKLQQGVPERRRDFRKLTNLVGVYWHTLDKRKDGAMIVENLSISGCGLRILTPHELKRGDTIRLEFKLDDEAESFIRIHGQLRWVLYDLIGIEFQSLYGIPQVLAEYIAS